VRALSGALTGATPHLADQAGRLRLGVDSGAEERVAGCTRRHLCWLSIRLRRSREALDKARKYGTSLFDLNMRFAVEVHWGQSKSARVNRELVKKLDVLFGNEEDFSPCWDQARRVKEDFDELPVASYEKMLREVAASYGNLNWCHDAAHGANGFRNAWGAMAIYKDEILFVPQREIDILDRVGGGDSFASGSSTECW